MKSPHEMSAAEKLLRLVEIECDLLALSVDGRPGANHAQRDALLGEKAALFKSVSAPPLRLMGEWRAQPWADAFAAQFPGVRADDVLAWFANAINAGSRSAYTEGFAAGKTSGLEALELAGETLETIRDGVQQGVIQCSVQMTNLETGKARSLGEYVAEALQLLGR